MAGVFVVIRYIVAAIALAIAATSAADEIRLSNNGSGFILRDQAGAAVSISGTTTSGLQEFLNLCSSSGYPCRATTGTGAPFVLQSALSVPPLAGRSVRIIGPINAFNFTTHAVLFDSMSRTVFEMEGIFSYSGTGSRAILFQPTNPLPTFLNTAIEYSTIRISSVIVTGGAVGHIVEFNPAFGAINNNYFEIGEVDGGLHSDYGIYIQTPFNNAGYSNSCFAQNKLRIGVITNSNVTQLQEGAGQINHAISPLGTNLYELLGVTVASNTVVGVAIYGVQSILLVPSISINTGSIQYGVIMQPGSWKNYGIIPQIQATIPIIPAGTGNVIVP